MVADSLHGISDHADQSCYKVKERIESEVGDSIFYHDGVAASGHEVNEIRGEKPGHDDNAKAPDPAVEDGLFDAFPDAADLSGTQILSAESSHCGTEYAKDQHEKLGDLSCRSVGNDDIGIVNNITNIISKEEKIVMRSINIDSHDGLFSGNLDVLIDDTLKLEALLKKLRTVRGVKSVERLY